MKYIAYYDTLQLAAQQRSVTSAAADVMEYMFNLFSETDNVEIISPARSLAPRGCFSAKRIKISDKISLRLPFSFSNATRLHRFFSLAFIRLWLFKILLFNCSTDETVVVYHSPALIPVIKWAKRLKRFNLILEIREVYSDVRPEINPKKEYDYFTVADKFIFATKLLNDKINTGRKPAIIAPGIYNCNSASSELNWDDNKTHLVYAGNFSKTKGGAYIAINLAPHLPENYVIHILGHDSPTVTAHIRSLIERQNKGNGAKIFFNGELRGDDFINFLRKCHIGLSTQNPEAPYNNTSFPSKILTYLNVGLEVVSADIDAVTSSPVGNMIHYYHNSSPEEIAGIIMKISDKRNNPQQLQNLHQSLKTEISDFLTYKSGTAL